MDSGASNTMFVFKEVFKEYKLVIPCAGDSAKAENGGLLLEKETSFSNTKSMGRNEKSFIPVVRGCLERGINQVQNPGIKSNSKMAIFDNHLAPVYYMCENIYPNVASAVRPVRATGLSQTSRRS